MPDDQWPSIRRVIGDLDRIGGDSYVEDVVVQMDASNGQLRPCRWDLRIKGASTDRGPKAKESVEHDLRDKDGFKELPSPPH